MKRAVEIAIDLGAVIGAALTMFSLPVILIHEGGHWALAISAEIVMWPGLKKYWLDFRCHL